MQWNERSPFPGRQYLLVLLVALLLLSSGCGSSGPFRSARTTPTPAAADPDAGHSEANADTTVLRRQVVAHVRAIVFQEREHAQVAAWSATHGALQRALVDHVRREAGEYRVRVIWEFAEATVESDITVQPLSRDMEDVVFSPFELRRVQPVTQAEPDDAEQAVVQALVDAVLADDEANVAALLADDSFARMQQVIRQHEALYGMLQDAHIEPGTEPGRWFLTWSYRDVDVITDLVLRQEPDGWISEGPSIVGAGRLVAGVLATLTPRPVAATPAPAQSAPPRVAAADTPTPEPPTATSEPPTATLEPTATITPTPEPESGFDSPTLVLRYDWRRDWPAWVEQSLMVAEDTITAQTLTDTGLQDQWSQPVLAVEGLTPDRAALQFLSRQGVGRIAPDGAVTWDWQPPQDFGHWAYHGGTREVAYVQNQDVFSIAAAPDAQPVRWTQQGIARSVLRFADADTLLVRTSTETNLMVLHRDGSGYHIPISWTFIVAPDHTVLALESESGVFWKPGATELELIADLSDSQSIMHTQMPQYGWLPKKQVLLLHSLALQEDATSGIFAFDRQRTLRQVIPSLVAAPGLPGFGGTLTDRRGAYAFAESSNRMALVWREEGNAGTFIIDVDASTAQPVTTLTPDRLFWPRADGLLLVVNEGDQLGTWWQPVDGSPARQLFQYRVEQATSLPDGRLLLIANKTLWQQQGEDAPQMIGEEGSVDDTRRFLRLTAPTGE